MASLHFVYISLVISASLQSIRSDEPDPPRIESVSSDFTGDSILQVDFTKDPKDNNEFLRLKCEGAGGGRGVETYEWHHNGSTLNSNDNRYGMFGGTLLVEKLRKTDIGDYRCFYTSKGGTSDGVAFSRAIKVQFSYIGGFVKANIPANRKTISEEYGTPLELQCPEMLDSAHYNFAWGGHSDVIGTYLVEYSDRVMLRPNGNLLYSFFDKKDVQYSKQYDGISCRVESSGGKLHKLSHKFLLNQRGSDTPKGSFSAELVDKLPPSFSVVEGGSLKLWCTAKGKPAPKFTWKKDGVQLRDNTLAAENYEFVMSYHILKLKKITKSMAGKYTCEATNGINNVVDSSTTEVKVESAPSKWIKRPSSKYIRVALDGEQDLVCQSDGNPAPTYEWYKNGQKVPGTSPSTSGQRFTQLGGTLKMRNLLLSDTAVFQCKAKNKHGEILAETYVKVIAYPPTFEGVQFGPFTLFRGLTQTLKCEPDAAPAPTRDEKEWLFESKPITMDNKKYRKNDDGDLVIIGVTEQDTGTYTCRARNSESKGRPPAEATAFALVLDPTEIIYAPRNVDTVRGKRVELVCVAKSDKTLEHKIRWYKSNQPLQYDTRIRWVRGRNRLIIDPADVSDTGRYKCEAYTSLPAQSIDTASALVTVRGPPEPPHSLVLSGNCATRSATLSWQKNAVDNFAPVLRYRIEYGSKYEPGRFFLLKMVEGGSTTTTVMTNLSPYANLMFRVRSVNKIGTSEPSDATNPDNCKTPKAAPSKFPDNLRGKPTTANKLDIVWDPFTKLDENAPGCLFILKYRRPNENWKEHQTADCSVEKFTVPKPGYYQLWEFKIRAKNEIGFGPESDVKQSYSGQDKPNSRPTGLVVIERKPRSVKLNWNKVVVNRGSVDGYRIYMKSGTLNTEDELQGNKFPEQNLQRSRREVKDNGTRDLPDPPAIVDKLTPYTVYKLTMVAFNSGGEGPPSETLQFSTPEDVPGPPTNVVAYPFAYYIMVRWDIPREINGRLVGYAVSIDPKSSDNTDVYDVAPNLYEHVFSGLQPTTFYNISVWAKTSKGDGHRAYTDLNTIFPDRPFKPQPPYVEGATTSSVNVSFRVGAGGGFPVRYVILYRPKPAEGEEGGDWKPMPKVEYLSQKWIEVVGLQDRVYQFASIGYNDIGASAQSDISEGRPIREPFVAARKGNWYDEIWFIVLIIIVVLLIIALMLVYIGTRKKGARYPVKERENDRAGILEAPPDDGGFNDYPMKAPRVPQGSPPPYESEGSLNRSDRDSLDDYGEDDKFNEDGSFIGEYSEDKRRPQDEEVDERDDSALATFV